MRRHHRLYLGALLTLLIGSTGAVPAAAQLTGSEAPDFVLKSLSGENLRLSEYRGEIVMLSFWATWCGDCRAQLEELAAMYERYQNAGVELLAVDLDQNDNQASRMARSLAVKELYAVDKMPVMVLIDRSGVVRDVFEGYRRGKEQQYLERVQALLRE